MADYRFTKQQRLLNAQDFGRVFNSTNLKASTRDLLVLGSTSDLGHSRIGFVIAKKHVRTAVQRNRIKRIIREYFRMHCDELNSVDLVILARKGIDQLSNAELNAAFSRLWGKLVLQSSTTDSDR